MNKENKTLALGNSFSMREEAGGVTMIEYDGDSRTIVKTRFVPNATIIRNADGSATLKVCEFTLN